MFVAVSRNITFASGEFYHIYNRGTEKRDIFLSPQDYERFLCLLYICNGLIPADLKLQGRTLEELSSIDRGEKLVDICCYCLMPNHFHLVLRECKENGISNFLQKVTTGYTMYFNKKNDRNGALFQGKFKATHVSKDRYLSYLISYIHLNPVKLIEPRWKETGIFDKEKAENYLQYYPYSSFIDYVGNQRPLAQILNKDALPQYFITPKDFVDFVTVWLQGSTL
jgi:putative transposase